MSDEAVNAFLGRGGDRATQGFLHATRGIENAEDVVGAPADTSEDAGSVLGGIWDDIKGALGTLGAGAHFAMDPASILRTPEGQQFAQNAANDVGEWGSQFWSDVGDLASGIGDELTAHSLQEFQDADDANAGKAWSVYEDVARPAGMAVVTPFLPAPVRAAAGAIYAPKFVSDAVNLYNGEGAEGDDGDAENAGGIGNVVQGMVIQPLEQFAQDVMNPGELASDIYEHPAALWDRVLMPGTMAEGVVRGAGKLKKAADARYETALDTLADMDDNVSRLAPDDDGTLPEVDVTEGESSPAPYVDTGHGELDTWMADAAAEYGVDLNVLHKMAQQESEHGRASSNVMQVLDSTGQEMGFSDMSDPKQSIYAGAAYLRKMLDKNDGDYAAAIRDYNGGGDPQYLEHVLSQPDYDTSGARPGADAGGYDVPAEAEYQMEPGVNHEGFSDLTEEKLRILDSYYAELTGGDHLLVTSMRDGTHSDPGHANGTAFDVANDALHDDALRAKLIAKAEELGLRAYDEFDRSNWTENTTGDNLHLSDTGSAINARSGARGADAWEDYPRGDEPDTGAPETGDTLTDVTGAALDETGDAPAGLVDDVKKIVDESDLPKPEDVNAPAKVDWGDEGKDATELKSEPSEARAADIADVDDSIREIEATRQGLIDDEVHRMEGTPGGKGTDTGFTYDSEGNVVGRFSTSKNPQWYQDAYKRYGRAPRREEYGDIALESPRKSREFGELENHLAKLKEVKRRIEENPKSDTNAVYRSVFSKDSLIHAERAGKGTRSPKEPKAEVNIKRGRDAIRSLKKAPAQVKEVRGAMYRREVGPIDFVRGKEGTPARNFEDGYGLAKILKKHGQKALDMIPEVIAHGKFVKQYNDRGAFLYKGYRAVVRKTWEGKRKVWLVTNFKDLKATKRRSPNDANAFIRSAPTTAGTISPAERTSSKTNVAQSGENVNENPLVHGDSNAPVKLAPGERAQAAPDSAGRMPAARLGEGKPKGHFDGGRVSRESIMQRAQELFGTIRTGRVGRGRNGVYDAGSDVARAKQYGMWGTMWHEVGHKIDQLLGLTKKAGRQFDREFLAVLNRKYEDGFLNHYRADELQPEGIAEFMKEYMDDPAKAREDFPKFYNFWKEEVGKDLDLEARVREMREMMDAYKKQPGGARILGDVHMDKPETLREKIGRVLDGVMRMWVDDKSGIREAERAVEKVMGRKISPEDSAYVQARIAKDRGASVATQLLTSDDAKATTAAANKIYGGVLKHEVTFPMVLDKVRRLEKSAGDWLTKNGFKDGQEALKAYLVARRFMEVHDLKTKDGSSYQMPQSYETYRSFVEGAPQALKDAAQDIYNLNENVLAIMHHEGMLSDELYKKLTEDHKHYVSLARHFDADANAGGMQGFSSSGGFINVQNNIKRLTEGGSVRDVVDPLQTIPKQLTTSLIAVERNRVAQKFVKNASFYGTGGIIEKVTGDAAAKDSSFRVWVNGRQEVYNTTPEIYQAFRALKPEGIDSLMKVIGAMPARFMRAGAVIYNPAFLAKNLLRDQLTAYLYSEYGYKPFTDMARGMFHLLKKDNLFHEYVNSGALMSSIINDSKTIVPELAKAYAKKGMREKIFRAINPYTSLPALSEFIEQSTRVGLYSRARAKGASITRATMEAREGTLDFGRAGVAGRAVNKYVPFFNAVIQDPVLFMEKFKKNPAQMMKRCAPMVLGSLALYAMIQSNEQTAAEYNEMLPYEKNMFWNIPVPKAVSKTGWVRYPKPFGPGFLFASLPERIADFATGKDKSGKGMKEWAKGFLEQFNPYSLGTLPQAVYEWNANYSFFRERSIVPQKEQKLPNAQQYGDQTSEAAKAIGKALNLSPRKIDNLGQNLFAGSWTAANNAIDTAAGKRRNNNPLSTLTVDPYRSPQSVQDFYDKMGEAEKAYNGEKNGGKPSGTATANYKMFQKANKTMAELNKKEREALAKGDDAAVDSINKQQLMLARSALAQVR